VDGTGIEPNSMANFRNSCAVPADLLVLLLITYPPTKAKMYAVLYNNKEPYLIMVLLPVLLQIILSRC
jgi:hypothetical protein